MTSNEDIIRDGATEMHGEDTPDVEGHIRKAHTLNDVRFAEPAEATPAAVEDDGPDVEGHIFRV